MTVIWRGEAHPRSRGENGERPCIARSKAGSSPLTRGKRPPPPPRTPRPRLIPAHAGKTRERIERRRAVKAHPRSRGENLMETDPTQAERGSSPLTRGKQTARLMLAAVVGLIPAHAGKTGRCAAGEHARWAHPRSRGENGVSVHEMDKPPGSSPLTRGKLLDLPLLAGGARLIPAHAGKTSPALPRRPSPWAHPRSRGENTNCQAIPFRLPGSSPLTRGKPRLCSVSLVDRRLIPAHAGKTSFWFVVSFADTAHPRSRGENSKEVVKNRKKEGSSPLTRGKQGCRRRAHG